MIRQGRLVLVIGCQKSPDYSREVIRLKSDWLTIGHSRAVGELWVSSPLRSDGPRDSQMGGWTSYPVAGDAQVRVGKQLGAAKGLNWKEAEWQTKIRACLLFLVGSWWREMLQLMTNRLSQVHMTVIQGTNILLLRTQFKQANHGHKRERGKGAVLTTHQLCDRGRADPDGQPGHILSCAEDRTSHLAFMHDTGFLTIYN
jgi:hypothetical protein